MERDYQYNCLLTMPRHELEEFSLRMIGRMVPEETMTELFTFEQEEVENDDRLRAAQLDALLRMSAIALSEVQQAFEDSNNANQNTVRMTRLLLWHFYAVSFRLEEAVSLEKHCEMVEALVVDAPKDVFSWVKTLTELLHQYAKEAEA
ncbi:exoribonuclease R [Thaumasiovibrio subtropicus]|uniref:exoribonuclease R n=1 Tax=Thaumasiovibrio subtropicus TaxID=1891207 RepID=UPI000B36326E|nr:exoribonuclease R [Thaumasiovibrio subtropicus]